MFPVESECGSTDQALEVVQLAEQHRVNVLLMGTNDVVNRVMAALHERLPEPVARWSPGDEFMLPAVGKVGAIVLNDVGALRDSGADPAARMAEHGAGADAGRQHCAHTPPAARQSRRLHRYALLPAEYSLPRRHRGLSHRQLPTPIQHPRRESFEPSRFGSWGWTLGVISTLLKCLLRELGEVPAPERPDVAHVRRFFLGELHVLRLEPVLELTVHADQRSRRSRR